MSAIVNCIDAYINIEAVTYFVINKEKKEVVVRFVSYDGMTYLILKDDGALNFLSAFSIAAPWSRLLDRG